MRFFLILLGMALFVITSVALFMMDENARRAEKKIGMTLDQCPSVTSVRSQTGFNIIDEETAAFIHKCGKVAILNHPYIPGSLASN